jgi:hypothetical protein
MLTQHLSIFKKCWTNISPKFKKIKKVGMSPPTLVAGEGGGMAAS